MTFTLWLLVYLLVGFLWALLDEVYYRDYNEKGELFDFIMTVLFWGIKAVVTIVLIPYYLYLTRWRNWKS